MFIGAGYSVFRPCCGFLHHGMAVSRLVEKAKIKIHTSKKTQTIAPGMIIRFSETASGHTYKVHWIRTVAPFQEAETLTILSNADGYVLFRRSADNGVYVMDCVTAEQIAVVETEREVA